MKNIMKYTLTALMMLVVLGGCSDDLGGVPVSEGAPIRFSAYVDKAKSRTYYGEYDATNNAWPVYWENGDEVLVYCPEAHTDGSQIATYTLSVDDNDNDVVELISGLNELKWGNAPEHNFYTFFPAERVFTEADVSGKASGTLVFSVNREQTAIPVTKHTDTGFTYHYSDMKSAVMAGSLSVKTADVTDDTVLELPFYPITTALDIEIQGPTAVDKNTVAETSHELTITGLTISDAERTASTAQPVAGGFYYNPQTKGYEAYVNNNTTNTTNGTATSLHITLNPAVTLEIQEGENVTPQSLKVTAFLLPQIPDELQITVHCDGDNGQTANLVRTVTKPTANSDGYKCEVALGKVKTPVEFSYEHWMASLDDDTYVSQISMPGSHDAGAYLVGENVSKPSWWDVVGWAEYYLKVYSQCQEKTIIEQLDLGIRCLDFRPSCSMNSDGTCSFDIAHGYVSMDVTFDDVMDQTLVWLAEHPTEFIIVKLKNENADDSDEFTYWKQYIRSKIVETLPVSRYIEVFDPSMKLSEARGKILFMSRDHYYSSSSITSDDEQADGSGTHWIGCKISGWGTDNLDLMTGKTFYTKTYPNTVGGIGTFTVSDKYRGDTDVAFNAPDESTKKAAIDKGLTAAKNDEYSDGKNGSWYFTYLNVRGSNRKTSTYNSYVAGLLTDESGDYASSYKNTGIIMIDWVGNSTYAADVVVAAVIENNFRPNGPGTKSE